MKTTSRSVYPAATRVSVCDAEACGLRCLMSNSVALRGNAQGLSVRRVLLKARPGKIRQPAGFRAKRWRPSKRVIKKCAMVESRNLIRHRDGPTTAHNELVGVTPLQKTAFAQASTCQPTAADLRSNRVTYWPLFSSPDTATGRVYDAMNL
ncbi:hypothetical protein ALQ36_101920 [Pseudomonas syringae pv. primulae]|uniref:Uncharacterized protein n=1 Tax=Pseudomonas syringae pv. primulae TaxID=251707 RepID=A0A3M4SJ79_9PSED|nr:hypothetical protein ALQ36_101920 [Pseudomonas syringae pv. primulae]RMR14993.1 hypothetical protein ALP92_101968 [Pseudomonas syringae pv. primulae]